jgi:hypothetical protein
MRLAPPLLLAAALALAAAPAQAHTIYDLTPDVSGTVTRATQALSPGQSPFAGAAQTVQAARATPGARAASGPAQTASLGYEGGQVLHTNRTHAIFWEPAGSGLAYPEGYTAIVAQFFQNVAADSHLPTNTYGLTGQYTDASGPAVYDSTWGGEVLATDPLPNNTCAEPLGNGPGWSVCIDDEQMQSEIEHVIAADHLKTGPNDIYFLIMPPGLGACESGGPADCALGGKTAGSFCGYHSVTDNSRFLYAVIPYNAQPGHCQSTNPRPNGNPVDPTLSTISHEQIETITDPYGDAWVNPNGDEAADICITTYGPALGGSGSSAYNEVIHGGHYYLQAIYSNWDHACEPRTPPDHVAIHLTGAAIAGKQLPLLADATAMHGRITSYQWTLGARGAARGAQPDAVLTRPGRYLLTVRSTDSAGLWAFAHRMISVGRAARRVRLR